jgi:23S rRNA (adenine2503-C2)-methyltransferase
MFASSSQSSGGNALQLYGLTRPEVDDWMRARGFSLVHAALLWRYLYWECAETWADMAKMPPKVLRALKAETALEVAPVARETHSSDGFTRKYLLALRDGKVIETVLMRFKGRVTACISSQAGCAMGCVFCATGQRGFERHLTTAEIVAQAVHVQRILRGAAAVGASAVGPADDRLRNVVLMGMGEPLHNYDPVMKAVDIMRDPSGLSLSTERITLSTVGVVPGILRLAEETVPRVHLAVSLHGATQTERAALVPVAKRWPLDELMAACRTYSEKTGRRIFYEWTLIEGSNDTREHARALGKLLADVERSIDRSKQKGKARRPLAQVNLIPLNPTPGFGGAPTRTAAAAAFQAILADEFGLPSTVRQRRGIDIAAGCGQLAAIGS